MVQAIERVERDCGIQQPPLSEIGWRAWDASAWSAAAERGWCSSALWPFVAGVLVGSFSSVVVERVSCSTGRGPGAL
jgi:hypothetical protein